ncbi:expressed unknown protein [Seminavis robusta]|uniref:Uncharacterized protein n=1 Tax=Seminavis robusta TaxID=568900 RepID=A0A9N8EB25_9STRA|nr:expressed unknown protein [Seminavis robusta]|eukprot:Sro830_g208260.1 n/a (277) ;mRNA; f:33634-34464
MLDLGTDALVAVRGFEVYWWEEWDPLWMAGFFIFVLSIALRFVGEAIFYLGKYGVFYRIFHTIQEALGEYVDWWFPCMIVYVCVCTPLLLPFFVYKVIRVVLIPLDPLLAIAHRASLSRSFYFPLAEAPHGHFGLDLFFGRMAIPLRYYFLLVDLVAGGRFKVYYASSDNNSIHYEDNPKWLIVLAILEEVLENIGGLLMAVKELWEPQAQVGGKGRGHGGDEYEYEWFDPFGDSRTLAIISLVFSALSAVFETGKYIGDYNYVAAKPRRGSRATP